MFFIPLLLAIAPLAEVTAEQPPESPAQPRCQTHQPMKTADMARSLIHPLGAEPQAQSLYAVVREVDGCNTPIVLTAQVGQRPVR
jgi:hypothetical protein